MRGRSGQFVDFDQAFSRAGVGGAEVHGVGAGGEGEGEVSFGLGCEFAAGESVEREPVDGRRRERREIGGLGFGVWDLGGWSGDG